MHRVATPAARQLPEAKPWTVQAHELQLEARGIA